MERIRNILRLGQSNDFPIIENFMFCYRTSQYETSCCCSVFPLRTAIYIFGALDIILGMLNTLVFLTNLKNDAGFAPGEAIPSMLSSFVAAFMILPALYALSGLPQSSARKVAYYYYAKVVQTILRPILEIWWNRAFCIHFQQCRSTYWGALLLFILLIIALHIYEAKLFFSYANLVTKGEIILANNGNEVVEAIKKVRDQAAIINAPSYTNIIVGSVIAPALGLNGMGIEPGQTVEIGDNKKVNN